MPVPTAQKKTIPEKESRGGPTFGCDIAPPTAALVPQWVYAVSTPIIARSNESVAKSDANGITVTNARESVQTSRGGGANDAGIETAGEWGVFFSKAVPLPARAIVYVLVDRATVHSLAA